MVAVFSVSEFVQGINNLLQGVPATVQGEVSNFKVSQNKFVWFDLKDDSSVVSCFMMKFELRQELEDGMEIRVIGNPGLFKRSGRFHLRAKQIELVGEGTLKRQYELLKNKLLIEGLFDPARKRELPQYPKRIGLITSRDAAAYTDVLKIFNDRWAGLEILLFHVQVQGASAPGSITQVLHHLNEEYANELDLVIMTRGGGSMEDLQAFNEEAVVRAVFGLQVPSIVAIGHERDETLAELEADQRASTPSNAAELAVPHRADVLYQIQQMVLAQERGVISANNNRKQQVSSQMDVLDNFVQRYNRTVRNVIESYRLASQKWNYAIVGLKQGVQKNIQLLQSYNPHNVLQRGYSITKDSNGKVITSVHQVPKGETISTTVHNGDIKSQVL